MAALPSEPVAATATTESIRQQLASSASAVDASGGDAKNLSVCFINDLLFAEEEDDCDGEGSRSEDAEANLKRLSELSADYIAQNNISKRKGQVIVPLRAAVKNKADEGEDEDTTADEDDEEVQDASAAAPVTLSVYLEALRADASQRLSMAKELAKATAVREKRRQLARSRAESVLLELASVLGEAAFEADRRLSRPRLGRLNVAKLQLVLNHLLALAEKLNEQLVQLLMLRDSLLMEQDSLLTDVEDITNGIRGAPAH